MWENFSYGLSLREAEIPTKELDSHFLLSGGTSRQEVTKLGL